MNVSVLKLGYDSGKRDFRMGRGPEILVSKGIVPATVALGHVANVVDITVPDGFNTEIQTQFQLYRQAADAVLEAKSRGSFPILVSGNCGATISAVSRGEEERVGLVWFDAHGDFNTPDTTLTGYLDGMGLAVVRGLCWKQIASSITKFRPVDGSNIVHVGGADLDDAEIDLFKQESVRVVDAAALYTNGVKNSLDAEVSDVSESVDKVHLHIDVDVLDPAEAPSNHFIVEKPRISVSMILDCISVIKSKLKIVSVTIASYDPDYDPEGRTPAVVNELVRAILQ